MDFQEILEYTISEAYLPIKLHYTTPALLHSFFERSIELLKKKGIYDENLFLYRMNHESHSSLYEAYSIDSIDTFIFFCENLNNTFGDKSFIEEESLYKLHEYIKAKSFLDSSLVSINSINSFFEEILSQDNIGKYLANFSNEELRDRILYGLSRLGNILSIEDIPKISHFLKGESTKSISFIFFILNAKRYLHFFKEIQKTISIDETCSGVFSDIYSDFWSKNPYASLRKDSLEDEKIIDLLNFITENEYLETAMRKKVSSVMGNEKYSFTHSDLLEILEEAEKSLKIL